MHDTWLDTDSDDAVKTEPGIHSVLNESTGAQIKSTPDKWSIEDGEDNKVEIEPDKITLTNASGYTLEASIDEGIVITKGADSLKIDLENGIVFSVGGKTGKYTVEQVLLDDGGGNTNTIENDQMLISGDGNTNSITNEHMVIAASGKTGVYEVNGVTYSDGSSTASLSTGDGVQVIIDGATLSAKPDAVELDDGSGNTVQMTPTAGFGATDSEDQTLAMYTDKLKITQGDDFVQVDVASGLKVQEVGYTAQVNTSLGLVLGDESGANVSVPPLPGENIVLQPTELMGADEAEFSAYFLRGDRE